MFDYPIIEAYYSMTFQAILYYIMLHYIPDSVLHYCYTILLILYSVIILYRGADLAHRPDVQEPAVHPGGGRGGRATRNNN